MHFHNSIQKQLTLLDNGHNAKSIQVTYNEFLPMLLGREVMEKHNLMLLKTGYLEG